MDKLVTSEVLVGDDFNGQIGNDMGGFGEIYWGFGIEQIDDAGFRLLD